MKKKNLVILSAAFMLMAFFLGSYIYKDQLSEYISGMGKGHAEPFVREYSPVYGDKEAKVTLVEFMDPACEACRTFHNPVKKLVDKEAGKVKLVIRYAPFHRGADYCVKYLEAARNQGKYWEALDLMFRTQSQWTHHHQVLPEQVWTIMAQLGLDQEKLKKDMDDPWLTELINQDLEDASTLQVKRTPGFFVNGRPLEKFGYKQLRELVLNEVWKKY